MLDPGKAAAFCHSYSINNHAIIQFRGGAAITSLPLSGQGAGNAGGI
jgi:hypothetical protein